MNIVDLLAFLNKRKKIPQRGVFINCQHRKIRTHSYFILFHSRFIIKRRHRRKRLVDFSL
jgi:hypothetical protein